MKIETYEFNNSGLEKLEKTEKGRDWPVVYMIYSDTDLYIGETTSACTRFSQHLANPQKQHLNAIKVVFDDTYNKSVILDFEQKLIKYCKADGKFKNILNKNAGQSSQHNYYRREEYSKTFKNLWEELFSNDMVENSMDILEDKNIFKYSPYNCLTEEQNTISVAVLNDIIDKLQNNKKSACLINGCAGTGKTVLAISMINSLINAANLTPADFDDDLLNDKIAVLLKIKEYVKLHQPLKIGFLFPMIGIRKTIKDVFKTFGNGLSQEIVIGPYDLRRKEFDILFVDESHRLAARRNLGSQFGNFDMACKEMELDPNYANQLEWALIKSKYCVLFYDENQSIKSTDITYDEYQKTLNRYAPDFIRYNLSTQIRCSGGDSYADYVKDILNCKADSFKEIDNYDFKIYDDIKRMTDRIQALDNDGQIGLSRTVAGYSWEWKTKPPHTPADDYEYYMKLMRDGKYDIEIQGNRYVWNLCTDGWLNRLDSHCTIGCIHTTQGFDLNYVGVIFGNEIDYDPANNRIIIDRNKFFDMNVKAGCDDRTLKRYIINTYTTMLLRGIKGCYVYACNKNLNAYLHRFIKSVD